VKAPRLVTLPGSNAARADLISVSMDMVGFRHASRRRRALGTSRSSTGWRKAIRSLTARSIPSTLPSLGWDETNAAAAETGFSSDNGRSWRPFGSTSPGVAGNIAMSSTDPNNLVWVPVNAAPVYSTDGGQSWEMCQSLPPSWQ